MFLFLVAIWSSLWLKIRRGGPLQVQNGPQQDLNKMNDKVNFRGQKYRQRAEYGGLQNGTQQVMNKMIEVVFFLGGEG